MDLKLLNEKKILKLVVKNFYQQSLLVDKTTYCFDMTNGSAQI